jgi:hypothetical protein
VLPPHDVPVRTLHWSSRPVAYARTDGPPGTLLRLLVDAVDEGSVPDGVVPCLVLLASQSGRLASVRVDLTALTTWQGLQAVVATETQSAHDLRFACRYTHVGIWRHADHVLDTLRRHDMLDDDGPHVVELLAWEHAPFELPLLVESGPARHLMRARVGAASIGSLLQLLRAEPGSRAYYENAAARHANTDPAPGQGASQYTVAPLDIDAFEPLRDTPGTVPYLTLVLPDEAAGLRDWDAARGDYAFGDDEFGASDGSSSDA